MVPAVVAVNIAVVVRSDVMLGCEVAVRLLGSFGHGVVWLYEHCLGSACGVLLVVIALLRTPE